MKLLPEGWYGTSIEEPLPSGNVLLDGAPSRVEWIGCADRRCSFRHDSTQIDAGIGRQELLLMRLRTAADGCGRQQTVAGRRIRWSSTVGQWWDISSHAYMHSASDGSIVEFRARDAVACRPSARWCQYPPAAAAMDNTRAARGSREGHPGSTAPHCC